MICSWVQRHRTDLTAAVFVLIMASAVASLYSGDMAVAGVLMLIAIVYLAGYDVIRGGGRGKRRSGHYVLFVWGDVEPDIVGPFKTEDERDAKALELRREEGDENGIYWLDVSGSGKPEVGPYTGGFLDGENSEDQQPDEKEANNAAFPS